MQHNNLLYSIPRVGIGIFVFKDGLFLMGKRHNAHGAGSWTIPGGHLEFGETFEAAAQREVFEETGLHITNIRFGAITNDFFEKEHKHYISIWLLSDWKHGEPIINEPDKLTDLQWVSFDELPSPLFQSWNQLFISPFFTHIIAQAKISIRSAIQSHTISI